MTNRVLGYLVFSTFLCVSTSVASAQPKPGGDPPKVEGSVTNRTVDDLVKGLTLDETERLVSEAELPKRGKVAVPQLCACLQASENSTEARAAAARCLRKIRDASAAPVLLDVYKNAGAPLAVRGEAALALGDSNATNAIPDLIEGLANNMFKVSETARQALIAIGDPAVEPLIAAYKKEMGVPENPKAKEKEREAYAARDGIVFRSLLILGDVGGAKARDVLVEAVRTQKGSRALGIRHHAGIALGLLKTSDKDFKLAIEPLLDAYAAERDFGVASVLVRSLQWLTVDWIPESELPPAQPYRWKAWWNVNKDKVLGTQRHEHEHIELPKNGLQKGDPLEEPKDKPEPPK